MNRTTLIIDGNWLLMSRLGVMGSMFDKKLPKEDLERAKHDIIDFIAQSINKAINFWYPIIDNIIMVQDGGSWRKTIDKPDAFTEEYKGNRSHTSEISWDYVWDALKIICGIFHENNITCISEHNIEGDDWCWYWSRFLNHGGVNCIIWSSDADLKQLVQRTSEAWTIWYNDKAGLFLPESLQYDDMDILLNYESVDPIMEDISKKHIKTNYISPDDIVMEKVICGDAGDNIKSVATIEKITKTGKSQVIKVSPKEWISIKKQLHINNIEDFKNNKQNIIRYISKLTRFKDSNIDLKNISDMFDYNMILVRLDKESIPKEYQMLMNKHKDEYKIADLDYIRNNYKVLSKPQSSIEQMFLDFPESFV